MCFLIKARMLGAGTIIAVDKSAFRLDVVRKLGADRVLDTQYTSTAERLAFVRDVTHERGADVVVECAGAPEVLPETLEMLRVGGMLLEAGNFADLGDVRINPHRHLCSKNVRLLGVAGEEPASYGPSLRQMARYMRQYPLREFVTHRYRLDDVEAAMRKAIAPGSLKVVIAPWM